MDLQSLFYLMSIILIFGWLVFLGMLIVMGIILFRKTRSLQHSFQSKIDNPPGQFLFWLVPLMGIIGPILGRLRRK